MEETPSPVGIDETPSPVDIEETPSPVNIKDTLSPVVDETSSPIAEASGCLLELGVRSCRGDFSVWVDHRFSYLFP